MSKYRGHPIEEKDGLWIYSDTKESVQANKNIACGHCSKPQTIDGHDGCLGSLPYVMNACCGHGNDKEAYVQYIDGYCVHSDSAILIIKMLKRNGEAKNASK